jgi:hypothetical protein
VVSVFLSGRPLAMDAEIDASDAFVAAWLPGSEGAAIADVLIGDARGAARYDFRGTLSFAWPASSAPPQSRFALGYGLRYAAADRRPAHGTSYCTFEMPRNSLKLKVSSWPLRAKECSTARTIFRPVAPAGSDRAS